MQSPAQAKPLGSGAGFSLIETLVKGCEQLAENMTKLLAHKETEDFYWPAEVG